MIKISVLRYNRVFIIALATGAILAGVLFIGTADSVFEPNLKLAPVTRENIEIAVNTVGILDAARSHMISSTIKGNRGIILFLIEDGAWVEKGDVLVKLDPTPFENEVHRLKGEVQTLLAAQEASVQMLEWEKIQVKQKINTAQYNLKVAQLEHKRLIEGDGPLQLAQYREEMEKAGIEYKRYQAFYDDLENLRKQGFENPKELVRAKENVGKYREKFETTQKRYDSYKKFVLPSLEEAAKAKVENAQLALMQTRQGSVFKVANAAAAVEQAKAKLQTEQASLVQAQNELEKTLIRAPFDGIAILYETYRDGQKRKPRIGDTVWMNQPLLYLPDISALIVKTQIREVDLHKITLKQSGRVRIDAYPEVDFDGEVSSIGALATQRFVNQGGDKFFEFTLSLKDSDTRLRPGMTAQVTISTHLATNVLTVPIQAIFENSHGKYCYRYEGRKFSKMAIRAGKQNEDRVEIIAGLKAGDRVSIVKPLAKELM
jgi:HlyD family secretion protein